MDVYVVVYVPIALLLCDLFIDRLARGLSLTLNNM